MDIYQIWTTYNRQWSRYEILAFAGVLILVCTAMAVCVHRKKLSIIQAVKEEYTEERVMEYATGRKVHNE